MIKKLTLMGVVGMVCQLGMTQTPRNLTSDHYQVFVDDYISKTVSLGKFVNYSAESATLADFKNKIVILSFWFTACPQCVRLLQKELNLQKEFSEWIQIIPVTYEPEKTITDFIVQWEQKHRMDLQLPMIVEDTLLKKAFPILYNPHYVWILPSGKMIAQTSELFLSEKTIEMLRATCDDTLSLSEQ